jgi:hypothetical protein
MRLKAVRTVLFPRRHLVLMYQRDGWPPTRFQSLRKSGTGKADPAQAFTCRKRHRRDEKTGGLKAGKAPEASRKQSKDLPAAILAALRKRDGAMVIGEGAPARWRLPAD